VKTNYIIMKGSVRLGNNVPMTALLLHAVATRALSTKLPGVCSMLSLFLKPFKFNQFVA
jgi:hypothetical protein